MGRDLLHVHSARKIKNLRGQIARIEKDDRLTEPQKKKLIDEILGLLRMDGERFLPTKYQKARPTEPKPKADKSAFQAFKSEGDALGVFNSAGKESDLEMYELFFINWARKAMAEHIYHTNLMDTLVRNTTVAVPKTVDGIEVREILCPTVFKDDEGVDHVWHCLMHYDVPREVRVWMFEAATGRTVLSVDLRPVDDVGGYPQNWSYKLGMRKRDMSTILTPTIPKADETGFDEPRKFLGY